MRFKLLKVVFSEDSSVMGCDALSVGESFLTFCRMVVLDCLTLMMKALGSFKMLGTACPVIQRHIPEGLNL